MYGAAPLALGALRKQKPDLDRVYTLPYGWILAPIAFTLAHHLEPPIAMCLPPTEPLRKHS